MKDSNKFLGGEWNCECGRRHEVPVYQVVIGSGVLSQSPLTVQGKIGGKSALIVSDQITHSIAGRKTAEQFHAAGFHVRDLVIPSDKPVVDQRTAEWLASQVANEDILISCGSGTITDLTKFAAHKNGRPFIAVATAPSMNGYASGIVAITENGIKKTVSAAPAYAVIADLEILCAAPIEMIRAGLGDVISKPVSMADWRLASLIKGEHFCPLPLEIIKDLEAIYYENPSLLAARDPKAVAALTEALIYSGISMLIAGSSAPASGGEHLISHTLDMQAALKGTEHDFHGAQVGVATILTAQLYERLLGLDPKKIDPASLKDHCKRDRTAEIKAYWGPLAGDVMKEYGKKSMEWPEKKKEIEFILKDWKRITGELDAFLRPAKDIKRVLTEAGAKIHYKQLNLSREEFKKAVLMAATMRSRYTVLDLADDLNVLEPFIEEKAGE